MTTNVLQKLFANVHDLAAEIGKELKKTNTNAGTLTDLTTVEKGSLVGAINELKAASAAAAGIKDDSKGATTTYSSDKIEALITAAVDAAKLELKGDPALEATLDTLKELGDELKKDKTGVQALTEKLAKALSTDEQSLSEPQQKQALKNLGLDVDTLDLITPLTKDLPVL